MFRLFSLSFSVLLIFFFIVLNSCEILELSSEVDFLNKEMAAVQGGSFIMGGDSGLGKGNGDASNDHTADLAGYRISVTEVTWKEWKTVRDWAVESRGYRFNHSGQGAGDNYPVTQIDWFDAVAWCNALSEYEMLEPAYYTSPSRNEIYKDSTQQNNGLNNINGTANQCVSWNASGFRLPTETQWEFAARDRGDNTTDRYAGWQSIHDSNITGNMAEYANNSGILKPVKSLRANRTGLYDMSGNVMEWCWDWHYPYVKNSAVFRGPNPPGSNSWNPEAYRCRVVRGGSYSSSAVELNTSYRDFRLINITTSDILGFRVVRNL